MGLGGARLTTFDAERITGELDDRPAGEVSREEVWSRIGYFYERIVPVAEEARVRLATHPDDPPMEYYRGVHQALINFEGLRRLYYCNHYHANPDNTILIGDDVDDLVLIDISGEEAKLEVLCNHKTSWHMQTSHCHPTWSWDGSRILYASDFGGRVNLYIVEP